MAALGKILLVLLGLALAFVVTIAAASEFGGEVVTLYTRDAGGGETGTSLWVVDEGGFQYLRAGDRAAGWFERLRREPQVRVERGGKAASYQALPTPDMTRRVDELMAQKYGFADRIVSVIRDPESSMAVRLVPAAP
jgi:hypothetical protein